MKRLSVLVGCMIVLSSLAGCQGSSKTTPGGVEGVVKGGGGFPESLAGTWKADTTKWQITLAPDANVVSFTNAGGALMNIAEGSLLHSHDEAGSYLYMVFGPCYANYDPATRKLDVTVTVERFVAGSANGALEGNARYFFTGPVSEDGKEWDVILQSSGGLLDQKESTADKIPPQGLTFHKVGKD